MIRLALIVGLGAFTLKRLLRYLQFFQQEEYDNRRLFAWIRSNQAWDTRGCLIALAAGVSSLLGTGVSQAVYLAAAAGYLVLAIREEDPRTSGKITLKMTARAKRIFFVAAVLALSCLALLLWSAEPGMKRWMKLAVYIQLIPAFLMVAKKLLQPDENARQQRFLNEAKANLAKVHPYVIGITGSYGKTSTKALLGRMLELSLAPTFWPSKSINTPMGISRELRESLTSVHKYAVIEMGAYRRGSISRLCDLTPPHAAIVTAVGTMHLERFGTPDDIYAAKSELPARVPADGILVCNGDNPGSRRMAGEFKKEKTFLYGLDPSQGPLDVWIDQVTIRAEGTDFTIHWNGSSYPAKSKLHGSPALSNILASFTMASALGADPALLVAAISGLEPFSNRLEVQTFADGIQINDAYNSNPAGFKAALEVLRQLPAKKRILVTPGMIELGDQQVLENHAVAKVAAAICDTIIFVGETNRSAFTDGLTASAFPSANLHLVSGRAEAFQKLAELRQPGDAVLLENDLPDLYEHKVSF